MWGWKPEKKSKMEKHCTLRKLNQSWKQTENLTSWKNKSKVEKKLRFDELNEIANDCK